MIRIIPPDEYKEILRTGNKGSEEYQRVSGEYSATMLGKDADVLKYDLVRMLNEAIFNKRNYMLMPAKEMYGLLPQYDYDVILPYVSVSSLKGQLEL